MGTSRKVSSASYMKVGRFKMVIAMFDLHSFHEIFIGSDNECSQTESYYCSSQSGFTLHFSEWELTMKTVISERMIAVYFSSFPLQNNPLAWIPVCQITMGKVGL